MKSAAERPNLRHRELLSIADLAFILNLSKSAVFKLRRDGDIPPPVELAGRLVRWRRREIAAWLDAGAPAAADWSWKPGMIASVGDLHELRLKQVLELNKEIQHLETLLAAGQHNIHVRSH